MQNEYDMGTRPPLRGYTRKNDDCINIRQSISEFGKTVHRLKYSDTMSEISEDIRSKMVRIQGNLYVNTNDGTYILVSDPEA